MTTEEHQHLRIDGERIYLRTFDASHARKVLRYHERNKEFLDPWEPARPNGFFTLDAQEIILNRAIKDRKTGERMLFWIVRHDDRKLLGSVHFFNIVRFNFQSCLVGYKLDKSEINQGYMTEALGLGVEHMFGVERLHRVEANIIPRNRASLRVVEKLGFKHEGLAEKYLKINGNWEDHIHMVKLNPVEE